MTEYTLYVDFHLIYFLDYAFLDDFMLCPADCNPAVLQRNDIVGIARGKVDVMDDDDDRLILLTHESPQNLHDLHRVLHIKVVERLIQEDILRDRKSTRLNSSHVAISYAVFCLKKKK